MRVTRETVPYFFWPATIAALVLLGLFFEVLYGVRGVSTGYICIAATLVVAVCIALVDNTAVRLRQSFSEDDAFRARARAARTFQRCMVLVALVILVLELIVPSSLSGALVILLAVPLYLHYLGYFALVRRFG